MTGAALGGISASRAAACLSACVGGSISASVYCRYKALRVVPAIRLYRAVAERTTQRETERMRGWNRPGARFYPTASQVHGIHHCPRIHWYAPQLRQSCSQVYSSSSRVLWLEPEPRYKAPIPLPPAAGRFDCNESCLSKVSWITEWQRVSNCAASGRAKL